MSVYVISYRDWEDCLNFVLTHEDNYTMFEFEEICRKVKLEAYENCLEKIREFNRSHSWDRNLTVWEDDLTYELVRLLVEKYGFKKLDCTVFNVHNDNCKLTFEL